MSAFPHRTLLRLADLSVAGIHFLLDEAEPWIDFNRRVVKRDDRLAGLTLVNAFFENSTRTALSFALAGKRLGADVVDFAADRSSVAKGETLADTARTIAAMRADVIVVRSREEGAADSVAAVTDAAIVNAGDGTGEHPTQGLLDALTIRRRFGRIDGLRIAICGDIRHSRVAGSNIACLPRLGAQVRLVGPQSLLPDHAPDGVTRHEDMDEGIEGADIVMMLRIQRERMEDAVAGGLADFHARYGLSHDRLARVAPRALVMHPGPINRGVEITDALADDPARSLILEQVEHGVAVRMACLDVLTRGARGIA